MNGARKNPPATPQLLVSVRSAEEALAALEGGAAVIDVKEPSRGSLGRADVRVIREVAAAVGRCRPVSAALGEWAEEGSDVPDTELAFVKWGLAGCRRNPSWRRELTSLLKYQPRPQPVLVAYADWQWAEAPSVEEVFALAWDHSGSVMLVDTYCKERIQATGNKRPTLLDWLTVPRVEDLCRRCRDSGVRIALAGSLGAQEIHKLRGARPDWFGVRGAVCADGRRHGSMLAEKVRELVELLARITSG